MILKVLLAIVVIIATVLISAASKPNRLRVERTVSIAASPEKVFPLINVLYNWPRWAQQDHEDPTMKRSFSDPTSGVGAQSE